MVPKSKEERTINKCIGQKMASGSGIKSELGKNKPENKQMDKRHAPMVARAKMCRMERCAGRIK